MPTKPRAGLGTARSIAFEAGEATYLGTDCRKGHGGLRFVHGSTCVECHRIAREAWSADRAGKRAEKERQQRTPPDAEHDHDDDHDEPRVAPVAPLHLASIWAWAASGLERMPERVNRAVPVAPLARASLEGS